MRKLPTQTSVGALKRLGSDPTPYCSWTFPCNHQPYISHYAFLGFIIAPVFSFFFPPRLPLLYFSPLHVVVFSHSKS
jgi:hypothetical protein